VRRSPCHASASALLPRVVRLLLTLVSLLLAATPAQASDELLGAVPGAASVSAYGGWVVFSSPTGTGAWTLTTWHEGVFADLGVAAGEVPFDADVGPDASGFPTVVYSRCGVKPTVAAPPRDCDLFAVRLGEGIESRLAVSTTRFSEFAPAVWGSRLAFGRQLGRQRKAHVLIFRGRKRLARLGPRTFPNCCRTRRTREWPRQMDLGSRAVAYRWILSGPDAFLDYGEELWLSRLDGSRARLAQSGWSSGACGGSRVFSPNVVGTSVLYGYWSDDCGGGSESLRRYELSTRRRTQADLPGPGVVLSAARDGGDVYWLRGDFFRGECATPQSPCELMRSRGAAFRRIKGGDDRPPLE
jgi:hypothetical protein